MVICQNCGFESKDNAKFCAKCGSEINNQENDVHLTIFCSNCGFEMDSGIRFCPNCGTSPTGEKPVKANFNPTVRSHKNPTIAAILSFLIVGLGQIYLGLTKKGIILFVVAVISLMCLAFIFGGILFFIIWGYGIYDAYNSAEKMKDVSIAEEDIDI